MTYDEVLAAIIETTLVVAFVFVAVGVVIIIMKQLYKDFKGDD